MASHRRRILVLSVLAALSIPSIALEQPFYAARPDTGLEPFVSTADSAKLPDGRRLHFVCMGKGSPTVILTAGLGDWVGAAWERFQPEVAKITRVCSWDRPGFGLSDGATFRTTVATNAADLEAGLAARAITGPYIMVGHSLGAFETLVFTDRNRAKVAGMVLIDPSYPGMAARAQAIRDRFHLPPAQPFPGAAKWSQCAADLRSGALVAGGPDPNNCVTFPANFPRTVRAALTAAYTKNPLQFETAANFDADVNAQSEIVLNPKRDYGDMPLVVLTAVGAPQGDPRVFEASEAEEIRGHDGLTGLSKRGRHVKAPGANHYIQRSNPELVLDAIRSVIQQGREGRGQ